MRRFALIACAVLVAGCGAAKHAAAPTTTAAPRPKPRPAPPAVKEEGPFGLAADQYWLFRPAHGKPKSMVIFVHGLGPNLPMLRDHRPWLRHLAAKGSIVVYPRYELAPGVYGALKHLVIATRAADQLLDFPSLPVVVIGYSRGGRLAVEYAAVSPSVAPQPVAILSLFPGLLNPAAEENVNLGSIDPRTHIALLVGDKDQSVTSEGAKAILKRLEEVGFPAENVEAVLVHSTKRWTADHDSVFDLTPEAKRNFWDRADRMIAAVR